jgi:FMN phosphatase YigB (HAD superfamily)
LPAIWELGYRRWIGRSRDRRAADPATAAANDVTAELKRLRRENEERLTRWGLIPFISVCVASAEVGLEKPDPAIFDLALRHAGCAASEAVMIGDRLDNDIRPARLLGWKTVRVFQGPGRFQSPRDSWDEPDDTVANVTLIPPIFMDT